MNQESKSRFGGYLSSQMFSNLKIATISFAIMVLLALNLFQLPTVSIFPNFSFSDSSGIETNIVFSYFLDFTHILSSIFIVFIFIMTIFVSLVLFNFYLNTYSRGYLFALLAVLGIFYLSVSVATPYIQKIEDSYLSPSNIVKSTYSQDYEAAYSEIAGARISEGERLYLNAQVSLEHYLREPNPATQETLNSDVRSINYALMMNPDVGGFYNSNIVYVLYHQSSIQEELEYLKYHIVSVQKKTYILGVAMLLALIVTIYNLRLYRRKTGL